MKNTRLARLLALPLALVLITAACSQRDDDSVDSGSDTTADDASRYRSDAEVSEHWKLEPVARLRNHLVERGWWGREQEEELLAECSATIDAAVAEYEALPPRAPTTMFDHLYAVLPAAYESQRAEVAAAAEGGARHG